MTLPVVPNDPFKDRPGAVQVVSRGEAPSIVQRMKRVNLADDTIIEERDRYQSLTVLNPNEKAAAAAYEALHDGRVIIDIYTTLQKAQMTGETGHMRLAVAHPSMKHVYMRRYFENGFTNNTTVIDFCSRYTRKRIGNNTVGGQFYSLEFGKPEGRTQSWRTYVASTPPIPAEVRLQHPDAVTDKRYLLLWEAEWVKVDEHEPRPPMLDPALLYQISGSMYSVVAVWDLTPVEAAALRPGPKF